MPVRSMSRFLHGYAIRVNLDRVQGSKTYMIEVSSRLPYSYSIGDEISSSNYRPKYCSECDADTPDECKCKDSSKQQYDDDVCKECGHDHSYHPDFSGVQTSIDIIPELQVTQPEKNPNNSWLAKAAKGGSA
jgi:hypothetical protein